MTQILILIIIGIIYITVKAFEGVSDVIYSTQNNKKLQEEYVKKFGNREIDTSKSLFDRNLDIISKYAKKIDPDSYRVYYIENLTRDCINEICLAENKTSIQPGSSYLSNWKNNISGEWITLANQIEDYFEKAKQKYNEEKSKFRKAQFDFEKAVSERKPPKQFREIKKYIELGDIYLEYIDKLLLLNAESWASKEQRLINKEFIPQPFQTFETEIVSNEVKQFNKKVIEYNKEINEEFAEHKENSNFFKKLNNDFKRANKQAVLQRVDYIINDIGLPSIFPKQWESDYDAEQSILILEISLPDIVHNQIFKKVKLKTKTICKPLTKTEIKEYAPKIHPAIILRMAYEIFRNDESETIKLLVINGWVEHDNLATGIKTKTYTSSLACNRNQILELNLTKLDPLVAFLNLNGRSAGALIDIIPVAPAMSLNKKDKRFIETREVLNNLGNETNLASMDWQDFESLIAELFQKEFADKGAEVKVTQSSRDRGVDAVIFDPDPIKGGKFVVQAKRYTKTVDVSSVRDLCAVVQKEGASRGILVTTSSYGADAYVFAQNSPITLLNGSELLGLLEKHGYKFRINIAEARKLLKETESNKTF